MPRKKGVRKTSSNIGGAGTTIAKSLAEQAAGLTGPAIDWVEEKIYPQDPEHPYESFSRRNPGATGAISAVTSAAAATGAYLLFRKYREWSKKTPESKKASDMVINKQPKVQLPPPSQKSDGSFTPVDPTTTQQTTTAVPSEKDREYMEFVGKYRNPSGRSVIIM